MTHYLLSIYQPDTGTPDDERLTEIGAGLARLNADIRDAGGWVFTGGLHGPETATVVRADGMITDGPYVEAKEHIGGLYVVDAADLDAALGWARRVTETTGLPVEIRPFQSRPVS